MRSQGPSQGFGDGTKYLAAALRFAGAIVMFLLGGRALDRWVHTTPLFTLIGMVVGGVLGGISVTREFRADPNFKGKMRSWSDKPRDSDSP